jgi:hypothetical protein
MLTAHPALPQSVLSTDSPGSFVVTMAGQMATYGHQPTCSLRLSDSKLLRICWRNVWRESCEHSHGNDEDNAQDYSFVSQEGRE